MPIRLAAPDTIIYLDASTFSCLWGVLQRRLPFRGKSRPEIGVSDRINWQFLTFIWSFRRKRRPQILALIEQHASPDAEVVRLTSRRRANRFVGSVFSAAERNAA